MEAVITDPVRSAAGSCSTAPSALEHAIDRAVGTIDPVLANLLITQAHHEIGLGLRELLGVDSGANFHAWATWGSREAGTTIREADVPGLHRLALAQPALHRARDCISAGNRMVLDEIGRESARFIAAGGEYETPVPGLRDAFRGYRAALEAAPLERRRELTFSANFDAVWHEHVRLQPYIAGAMPLGLRHVITRVLLDFRVGARHRHVARGLTPGTGARDWSSFPQRMRYVHDLFRVQRLDPEVFAPPYDPPLTAALRRELELA